MCAAAAAGTATGLFNPLDTLRVRWQLIPVLSGSSASSPAAAAVPPPAARTSLLRFAGSIVASEGFFSGLWRPGVFATMLSMGTSCGIRMGSYPYLRDWVAGNSTNKTPLLMFGTGLFAGGVGYWVSCPFFQAKTRLQVATILQPEGRAVGPGGVLGEMGTIWREGGVASLFRGASPLVVRGSLFSAGQTLGYDGAKTILAQRMKVMEDGPVLHMLGSVVAAFFATVLSAPADVVMTRYQAAAQIGKAYAGPLDCFANMVQQEGVSVFYRGWSPYFLRIVPVFLTFHPLFEQLRLLAGLTYMT